MKSLFSLYKKELSAYYHSLLAYIFIIVFLVVLSWLSWQNIFLVGQASMRDFFNLLPWFFIFLLPALTMRIWSEEKRHGTMETLLTLPVTDRQTVLAKFAASSTFVAVVLLCSLPFPITLSRIGVLDWGQTVAAYIGAWLFALGYLALGQWISSLTKNQIIAFLITVASAFLCMIVGLLFFDSGNGVISTTTHIISTYTHFQNFVKGVIDLRDVLYYLSFIFVFLYLNSIALQKHRHTIQRTTHATLVIAILVVVNVLVQNVSVRFDATENKQHTLAQSSRSILSAATDPITIKLFFSEELPQDLIALQRDVNDVIAEYQRVGGEDVIVERITPDVPSGDAVSAAQNEATQYGIPPIQFNIVENDSFAVSQGYAGMAILYQDDIEAIPVISDTDNLEYEITAAIQKMTREVEPVVGILNAAGAQKQLEFEELLREQYTVNVATFDTLSDFETLIIAGATETLTKKELYALDQFVISGGTLYVFIDGIIIDEELGQIAPNETNIQELLAQYGAAIDQNLVADFGSPETLQIGSGPFSVLQPYPLWPRITESGLNTDSSMTHGIQSIVMPWVSSIAVQETTATVTPIVSTSENSYAFDELPSIAPDALQPPKDAVREPQVIAAHISGNITSFFSQDDLPQDVQTDEFVQSTEQGNVIVVGDSQFISDDLLVGSPENALLALNAVDILTQDISLIDIRSRSAFSRPIRDMNDATKSIIKYGNIFSSCILVIIAAAAIYIRRRRKDRVAQKRYA